MHRHTTLLFVTSAHLALFAVAARPTGPSGWTPTLAFGGASALLLAVGLFREVAAGRPGVDGG